MTKHPEKRHIAGLSNPENQNDFIASFVEVLFRKYLTIKPETKAVSYGILVVSASILSNVISLPQGYFSDKRNVFNRYFVKFGWGWTLLLVILFTSLNNLIRQRRVGDNLVRPLQKLVCATTIWYICTHSFEWLEHMTGTCTRSEYNAKRVCIRAGFSWLGFDISGHCFLLVFSLLYMAEEIKAITELPGLLEREQKAILQSTDRSISYQRKRLFLRILTAVLVSFTLLWECMLLITNFYFHTLLQKLIGAMLGIGGWFVMYKLLKIDD